MMVPQRARSLKHLVTTLSQVARVLNDFQLASESQTAEKLKRDLESLLSEDAERRVSNS